MFRMEFRNGNVKKHSFGEKKRFLPGVFEVTFAKCVLCILRRILIPNGAGNLAKPWRVKQTTYI